MAQNIYDDPEFYNKYSEQIDRRVGEEDGGATEWSSLTRMLPNLKNLNIVDLGCGHGWFCRYARAKGAKQVLGLDISSKMIDKAREMTKDDGIKYCVENLEQMSLPENSYDLAYSSLAFHYIEDLSAVFEKVFKSLKAGGCFLFSVEHPVNTAILGEERILDENGQKSWVLNGYMREGKRIKNWLVNGIVKYHRLIATYVNLLVKNGFVVKEIDEWSPSEEQLQKHPDWEQELEWGRFLIIAAAKP